MSPKRFIFGTYFNPFSSTFVACRWNWNNVGEQREGYYETKVCRKYVNLLSIRYKYNYYYLISYNILNGENEKLKRKQIEQFELSPLSLTCILPPDKTLQYFVLIPSISQLLWASHLPYIHSGVCPSLFNFLCCRQFDLRISLVDIIFVAIVPCWRHFRYEIEQLICSITNFC